MSIEQPSGPNIPHQEQTSSDEVVLDIEQRLQALEEKYSYLILQAEQGEPVGFSKHGRTIEYNPQDNTLNVFTRGGWSVPLSWGDIRSALLFNVEYQFGDTHSREKAHQEEYSAHKKAFVYLAYEVRRKHLESLRTAYRESINPLNKNHADDAYAGIYESLQKNDEELSRGRLAEKMLLGYLMKYFAESSKDCYPYDPGPVMDVDYRVDIAVQIRTVDGQNIGVAIQFTADTSEKTWVRKDKEVQRGIFKMQHDQEGYEGSFNHYFLITSDIIADILCDTYQKWRTDPTTKRIRPISKCDPRGPFSALDTKAQELLHEHLAYLLDKIETIRIKGDIT